MGIYQKSSKDLCIAYALCKNSEQVKRTSDL